MKTRFEALENHLSLRSDEDFGFAMPVWYGLTSYRVGLELQEMYYQKCFTDGIFTLIGLEHEPVITLGKRSHVYDEKNKDLQLSEAERRRRGIDLIEVDRGGHATLHSPGQLVIYPILNLRAAGVSVKDYVCWLQKKSLRFLNSLGIQAFCEGEPGIFTEQGKIGFIGIRVDRGVTRHGISLNINNDLTLFESIRSCGSGNQKKFSSLQSMGVDCQPSQAFEGWIKA